MPFATFGFRVSIRLFEKVFRNPPQTIALILISNLDAATWRRSRG